jgi:hypothetical protein
VADLAHVLAGAIATVDPTIEKRIETDPQATLDLVVITAEAYTETGRLLISAVASARASGWSWEAVGRALGMSRQAAQQRFGLRTERAEASITTQRVVGLTAFNEIEILNEKGRHGWHSIAFGPLFHDLEKSGVQWEHRRMFVGSRKVKTLEAEGWQQIGHIWFPWIYLKKSLGIPAEPED